MSNNSGVVENEVFVPVWLAETERLTGLRSSSDIMSGCSIVRPVLLCNSQKV